MLQKLLFNVNAIPTDSDVGVVEEPAGVVAARHHLVRLHDLLDVVVDEVVVRVDVLSLQSPVPQVLRHQQPLILKLK